MVGTAMFGEGEMGGTAMFGAGRNRVDWEIPPCLVRGETGWIGRYCHVW